MPKNKKNETVDNLNRSKIESEKINQKENELEIDESVEHLQQNKSENQILKTNTDTDIDEDYENKTKISQSVSNTKQRSIKEKLKMLTKSFEPRELIPFSKLRTINQKDMVNLLEQHKLGIVIKDQLKIAVLNMETYEHLLGFVQEYAKMLDWLEEQELFEKYQLQLRLANDEWEEKPKNVSLLEWTK